MFKSDEFKRKMYKHLFEWKKKYVSREHREYCDENDLLLFPHFYPPLIDRLMQHHQDFPFKFHKFTNHMASSQIACFNSSCQY